MLSLLFVVFTLLVGFLIPCLYYILRRRLRNPLSLSTRLELDKIIASTFGNDDERSDKRVKVVAKENGISESGDGSDDDDLPNGLKRELMPRHVAVILDGNRRWAERQGLQTFRGHDAGARRLSKFLKLCLKWRIETVSAFAFSTENWGRSKTEIDFLMALLEEFITSMKKPLQKEGIKTSIIGNRTKLSESLLRMIDDLEEATKNNTKMHFILAIDYGGRFDFLQACKSLVKKSKEGLIEVEDVNEALIEKELLTKCTGCPHPDLLIRTSGEQRISNFFLWQLAYTELFFTPVLWPDFGKDEFIEALASYQRKERRFGGGN